MKVLFTPTAESHVEAIEQWWRSHRPAAPGLFAAELAAAVDLLSRMPGAGRRVRRHRVEGLRRILMRATRHHVFYVPDENGNCIVLAVWSAVRGTGPTLR